MPETKPAATPRQGASDQPTTRHLGRRRWLVAAIAVAGLAVSVGIWQGLVARERELLKTQFERDAQRQIQNIERQLQRDLEVVRYLSAFYAGSEEVSRLEFRTFGQRVLTAYRELHALEWVEYVPADRRDAHEKAAQAEDLRNYQVDLQDDQIDLADYQVLERTADGRLARAGQRDTYFPVFFVEPWEEHREPPGLDLGSNPQVLKALEKALADSRKPGEVTATGEVPLPSEEDRPVAIRVFDPVRRSDAGADRETGRWEGLRGFVSVVIRVDTMAEQALHAPGSVGIDVHIFDKSAPQGEQILYMHASEKRHTPFMPYDDPGVKPEGMHHSETLKVAGRSWLILCTPTDAYASLGESWAPPPIASLVVGVLITALLAMYVNGLLGRTEQVEQLVVQRAADLRRANESLEREVAERKRTEQVLRDSEALYSSLVENLPVHVLRKDLQGRFTFANESFCQLLGRPLEEIVGKTDLDFYPPELAGKYRQDDKTVAETGELFECVEENKKGGETRYVQVMKSAVRDAEGKIVGVQVIFWDVTARRKAEAALEQERYLLRALMDNLPHNIYFKDTESRFTRINKALADYFGLNDASEALGKTDVDFFTDEHAQQALADEQEVMRTGEPLLDKEEKETWMNGRETWASTTKLPLYNEEGEIAGTFGISRDITEKKRAAEALRAAKEAAESASRAKSAFLANMSHEIRTPMNVIIGMTELVLDTRLTAEQREYLMAIQESSEALLSLISDVLDFSKIEAGRLDLDTAPFDLHETLGDTMRWLAIRAHGKGLELACHIRPDVPVFVVGDRNRLRQIVVNLLSNAIKFTDHGEVVLDVRHQSQSDGQVVLHFAVSDTGIGIAEDKLAVIFDAFEQADNSTTRRYGGTGLGLAISSKLVELMGGRIWAESQVGQGSRFHFTARFDLAPEDSRGLAKLEPAVIRGTRVLVVDDNATNRLILEEMLGNWGVKATSAPGGREALHAMREARRSGEPFLLVISDVHMPEMDGFELLEEVKRDREIGSTIIMMLTSGDHPGDIARCEQMGVAAYLLKPVKQSELFDAIMMALGISAAQVEPVEAVAGAPYGPSRSLRVLLAEDSLVNQKLAIGLLRKQGHAVVVANTGKEALAAWEMQKFDLIIMDVQMPDMDGLEPAAAIRSREKQTGAHIPIIAMTAHAMKGDRERCLKAGMDEYVSKPIRAKQLFDAITAQVSSFPVSDAKSGSPEGAGLDWEAALRAVKGDRELLNVVVDAVLEESPKILEEIRRAVAAEDATALRLAAHTLKGSVRYFGQTPAYERAYQLEQMGRSRRLENVREILAVLEGDVARLTEVLLEYGRSQRAADDG